MIMDIDDKNQCYIYLSKSRYCIHMETPNDELIVDAKKIIYD